jgi:citrate lyase subunit beta/citryl-CoA lyase
MDPFRSVLFVPGHKPEWIDKAAAVGPDAIVLDLEDSVPEDLKEQARTTVAESIARASVQYPDISFLVRINSLATGNAGADMEACLVPGLDGLFLPKIETAVDLAKIDALVDHFERRNGASGVEYIIPIETVPAIWNVREIAHGSPRVGAMIGPTAEHADIAREVGFEWTPGGLETLYLRSRVLLAIREAGIHALTGLWEKVDDLTGLEEFARSGRTLGYRGMIVIHPSHVSVVNSVFTPSDEEVEFYQGQVAAYESAAASGQGALRYRGLHIDKAHYDKAVQWLERAHQLREGK